MTAALAELDRWADDGGPVADGGPGFPPLTVDIRIDATAFYEALGRAVRQAADAFQRIAEAVQACGKAIARAFGVPPWLIGLEPRERPVDRARRLYIDRAMRARARRARRHGRVLR